MALVATGILVLALVGILLRARNLHESVYAGAGGAPFPRTSWSRRAVACSDARTEAARPRELERLLAGVRPSALVVERGGRHLPPHVRRLLDDAASPVLVV
jgi:hypothetical protein